MASYWSVTAEPERGPVAWSYAAPNAQFAQIERYFGFYPGRVECFVGDERVRPQPGGFYGGWITDEIVGPWKGEPGTGRLVSLSLHASRCAVARLHCFGITRDDFQAGRIAGRQLGIRN